MHFRGYIQKITRICGQQERNRDWSKKSTSNRRLASPSYSKGSQKLYGKAQLHSSVHLVNDGQVWLDIQNVLKVQFWQVGWRMSSSIRQGERVPYKCTSVGTTCTRKTFDLILNSTWKVNEMRSGTTLWNQMQKASQLLPGQEIHGLWVKVLIIGEDVLCTSMGSSKA